MKFTTNKYTRPVLLQNLRSINARNYVNYSSFINAFSPRAGEQSAKVAALRTVLNLTSLSGAFSTGNGVNTKKSLIRLFKNS
jgi:hypothetical protein